MTDTAILDGLMATLQRNPLDPERLGQTGPNDVGKGKPYGLALQQRETDEKPFYARREVVKATEANANFAAVVDLFHEDDAAPRLERPRQGSCPRVTQEFDGVRWTQIAACGGLVHAVETIQNGAVRVDGKCLKCGTEIHRAGLLKEN